MVDTGKESLADLYGHALAVHDLDIDFDNIQVLLFDKSGIHLAIDEDTIAHSAGIRVGDTLRLEIKKLPSLLVPVTFQIFVKVIGDDMPTMTLNIDKSTTIDTIKGMIQAKMEGVSVAVIPASVMQLMMNSRNIYEGTIEENAIKELADLRVFRQGTMLPPGGAAGVKKTIAKKESKSEQQQIDTKQEKLVICKAKMDSLIHKPTTTDMVNQLKGNAVAIQANVDVDTIARTISGMSEDLCDQFMIAWDKSTLGGDRFSLEVARLFVPDINAIDNMVSELLDGKNALMTAFEFKYIQEFFIKGRFQNKAVFDLVVKRKVKIDQDKEVVALAEQMVARAQGRDVATAIGDVSM